MRFPKSLLIQQRLHSGLLDALLRISKKNNFRKNETNSRPFSKIVISRFLQQIPLFTDNAPFFITDISSCQFFLSRVQNAISDNR
jgi:hypothetical protein